MELLDGSKSSLKWEYLVKQSYHDEPKLKQVLNDWAEEGWELVTVYPTTGGRANAIFRKKKE